MGKIQQFKSGVCHGYFEYTLAAFNNAYFALLEGEKKNMEANVKSFVSELCFLYMLKTNDRAGNPEK